jgi:hypothetical protein
MARMLCPPLVDRLTSWLHFHAQYRLRIKRAIRTGTFEKTPGELAVDTDCELGKWLHYEVADHEKCTEYHTIKATHREFHLEIAEIIAFVLEGRTREAERRVSPSSEFSRISTTLNRELTKWRSRLL